MSFSWDVKIKGFGPFFTQSTGSINRNQPRARAKVAIYSANGQGKTCLSRMFRAVEVGAGILTDSNITQGQNDGTFEFITRNSSNDAASETTLRIGKHRGTAATISNSTGLLFHVFNSDYIKHNLEAVSYSPSGQIDGYIVGKDNIDVSGKKESLKTLLDEGGEIKSEVQAAITQAQNELVALGVTRTTTEFRNMTYEGICNLPLADNAYDEKLDEYMVLKDLPDDLPQLGMLRFQAPQLDFSSLMETIATAHSRASFTDDFLAEVSGKIEFITEGMRLNGDGKKCPFCGQKYNDDARKLLHLYDEYLDGQEARIVNGLRTAETQIDELRTSYVQLVSAHLSLSKEYDKRKMGFTNLKDSTLSDLPAIEELDELFQQARTLIDSKCQDISKAQDATSVEALSSFVTNINTVVASVNEAIAELNTPSQRLKRLKTNLRKVLCAERSKKIRVDKDDAIRRRNAIAEQYLALQSEIREDKARSKKPKRDAVAEMFEVLIKRMFGDKYTFDKDRFCILFGQNAMDKEAEQILSDGEKSIVAFCHYVASTFQLFADEDDAQRLMFVIDDPISSLDYHCVYNVAQTIKSLGSLFRIESKNQRLLVMTHNSAFFNMLCRNKIVEASYTLHDGRYEQVRHNGITHYDEHLRDINKVFQGGSITHTTGNSIRQVIEGIWHFDDPTVDNLADYLNQPQCADLSSCDYLYLLCNDQSHGAVAAELDPPIDETRMRRACSVVLQHVNARFPGQLKASGIVFEEQETG
ncbi:MAG: AAA family ATPase [Coriobacteriales bacterium]|nr:AAA family ATPase [Coriobacteriales bacterium]